MGTSRRVDGETPNKGAYAILNFLDASGEPIEEKEASHVEVVEYDEDGEVMFRTYGVIPKPEVEPQL